MMSRLLRMPKFLVLLFFVEMWERFSYYGMRALLVLFLTSQLGFDDPEAYAIYSLFAALCYLGPIVGGYIADRYTGFRALVLLGSIILVAGHLLMALSSIHDQLFFTGLGMIAVGSGLFKGNIANLLGCCYEPDDPERERGFTLFYVAINMGGFIAGIACGYVAHIWGWHYGFGLAGVGMTAGLLMFMRFQHLLADHGLKPSQPPIKGALPVKNIIYRLLWASTALSILFGYMLLHAEVFAQLLSASGILILILLGKVIYSSEPHERPSMWALVALIMFTLFFFAVEMQLGSLINLFTERNVQKTLFGIVIPASVSQSINPFAIMLAGPFASLVFLRMGPKWSMARFAFGLLIMTVSFLILYAGCLLANAQGYVDYGYLFFGLAIMGISELFVAPLVISACTILAPKKNRGLMMGLYNTGLAYSNFAGMLVAKFVSVPKQGAKDPLQSLSIYTEGFYNIMLFNLVIFALFVCFYPLLNRIIRQATLNESNA